jgi:dynactin complex subunit
MKKTKTLKRQLENKRKKLKDMRVTGVATSKRAKVFKEFVAIHRELKESK